MQAGIDISERHAVVSGCSIRKAYSADDIDAVGRLAEAIWYEYYKPIIGAEQVLYMLAQFQNPAAILAQIRNGYAYYLLYRQQTAVGYFSWLCPNGSQSLHLSKLYLLESQRGCGLGKLIISFTVDHCFRVGVRQIWLTVNRHNLNAIQFYSHMGFENAGELVQDIGGGFVMDDFKLIKNLL